MQLHVQLCLAKIRRSAFTAQRFIYAWVIEAWENIQIPAARS